MTKPRIPWYEYTPLLWFILLVILLLIIGKFFGWW